MLLKKNILKNLTMMYNVKKHTKLSNILNILRHH